MIYLSAALSLFCIACVMSPDPGRRGHTSDTAALFLAACLFQVAIVLEGLWRILKIFIG